MDDGAATISGELVAHRVVGDHLWSIATLRQHYGGTVPLVGKLLGANIGDTIEVAGAWNEHKTFGRQFKVSSCEVIAPITDSGAVAWMAHRLPSIGKTRALAMLKHFGGAESLWQAIERTPDRLAEVKGVTLERSAEIVEAYARFRHDRDRMILFRRWGMTENQIARMLVVWGDDAEDKLRANPYQLSEVVDGFGFIRADSIAQRMGIPLDSVPRIQCGLRHTMEQAAGHGHCYVSSGKLVAMAATKVLRINGDKVALELHKMKKQGELIQHGERVFSRHLNEFEKRCADSIRALLRSQRRR